MGILDELRADFGEDAFHRERDRQPTQNWCDLCVCGHLGRYHSTTVGGGYQDREPYPKHMGGGRTVLITTVFDGCVGAVRNRGVDVVTTETIDREANTMVERVNVTCPCAKLQPIAKVDRPNRYFNQRVPHARDREDPLRHPFLLGIRAFTTHLSRRRAALTDPDWPAAEFDRRFLWLDGKRRCGLSKCTETDGVWPVYVDGERSELRCAAHR